MLLYPAIDLLGGRVVRLREGDYDRVTDYGDDALAVAAAWREAGATWLHVVDLDAARGSGDNRAVIARLAAESGLKVQLGGGIRSAEIAADRLGLGVSRLVIGTWAVREPAAVGALLREAPGSYAIACDSRDEVIRVEGWTESGAVSLSSFAKTMQQAGARVLIFTDIARDGVYTGPGIERAVRLREETGLEVILSAGVRDRADVMAAARAGLDGLIIGRALHDGRIELGAVLEELEQRARERAGRLWAKLRPDARGLVPIVTVAADDGMVLMQAFVDEEALAATLVTGYLHYHSRSRGRLWMKGETSGHVQRLIELRVDCDADCLLARVEQTGVACHLGTRSCFARRVDELLSDEEGENKNE
ncbi:MAG: phosphoribosyl-AMP cyclohydrolase [Bacillota bacterium]|nr:phosphoribosyl-AMP cyclohydrolase [Bacillota bacterium]